MARATKAKNPDQLTGEREKRREEIEQELAEAVREKEAAYAILEIPERGPNTAGQGTMHRAPEGELTIPERRQAVEDAQELRRETPESLEAIAADEAQAHHALEVSTRRIASLNRAEATLRGEIKQIERDAPDYFRARTEEGSSAAVVQMDKLLAVFDETTQVLKVDAWAAWTRLEGVTGEKSGISTDDLGHVRVVLENVRRTCCWPGQSEANYRLRSADRGCAHAPG
jgi:hypothetical protein